MDQENILIMMNRAELLEESKTETAGKVNAGNKNMAACSECSTFQGRKDKLTAICLKRLSLKREKIS